LIHEGACAREISDSLWLMLEPLPPPPRSRPKGGRPPISTRAAPSGILFVLRSGIPWDMLPLDMGCGSGVTCWRRPRDGQAAGVWERLRRELLRSLQDANRIDWSRAALDSSSIAAKEGGVTTGPKPTDLGRPGTKRHLITDRQVIPLTFALSGANVHDSVPFEQMLDAIPAIRDTRGRLRRRQSKLHADKTYDHHRCRYA
jgi:transposase